MVHKIHISEKDFTGMYKNCGGYSVVKWLNIIRYTGNCPVE